MSFPAELPDCPLALPLSLLGRSAVLATDSPRIAEILRDVYASEAFAPGATGPAALFRCCTACPPPWVAAFAVPDRVHLAQMATRGAGFPVFRWTEDGPQPEGHFDFDESSVTATRDTVLELFAAHFQRRVLQWLLRGTPALRLVHAGAVSYRGRGALILADSFGGKSTLTLAAVLAGAGFLSDDFSPVDLESGLLLPFPRAIRLRRHARALAPSFEGLCHGTTVDARGETRYYVRPDDIQPGAVGERVPLTHVVTISGFGPRSELAAASPADFAAALVYADCFSTGDVALDLMWRWSELLPRVRCASLVAGPPHESAARLLEWLESAPAPVMPTSGATRGPS